MYLRIFFFFKQKTAYEMRISDWSSDVCSSDLVATSVTLLSNVTLLGCGQQSVIKLGAAAETNVITMGDAVSNVLIDSLKVDGNRANQATQVGVGIRGSTNLENIEVRDCWEIGRAHV